MLLQILAGVTCLIAALFQFAVHRCPDIPDCRTIRHARKITVIALLVGALILLGAAFAGRLEPLVSLVCGLFSLGQILFGMHNLLDEERTWKSHLSSSN